MLSRSAPRTGSRILLIGLLTLVLAGTPLARKLWSAIGPEEHAGKVPVMINGKERLYWRLKKDTEQVLRVTGPGTLRLISRVPLSTRVKDKVYKIHWSLDDGDSGVFEHKIRKAQSALRKTDSKKVSRGRSNEIEIPPGQHLIRVDLEESPTSVAYLCNHVRLMATVSKAKNVDVPPVDHGSGRMIKAGDAVVEYHALPSGEEMHVEINGPTFLKVISRLDWNQTMTGTQKYTLRVYEDGLAKQSYILKGRPSNSSVYLDKPDTLPARGEVVYIEVPEGRHRYTFGFQEAGRELNLRFLAPPEALINEVGTRN